MRRRAAGQKGQSPPLKVLLTYFAVSCALFLVAVNLWLSQQNARLSEEISFLDRLASSRVATLRPLRFPSGGAEKIVFDRIWELPGYNWAMVRYVSGGKSGYPALARLDENLEPLRIYTSAHGLNATEVIEMVADGDRVWALHGRDGEEGRGVSVFDPDADNFHPMTSADGLASDSVREILPLDEGTFATFTDPSLGIGRYLDDKGRWQTWEAFEEHVPGGAAELLAVDGLFYALPQVEGIPGAVERIVVISPHGELLADASLKLHEAEGPTLLTHLGQTRRGLFIGLSPSATDTISAESLTLRFDLNTLEVTDFRIEADTDRPFSSRSDLPFFNWGNMALFQGDDGSVAALDEHTGETQLLQGLQIFENVENAWHHQGELWISSHHPRGLLPGQWKLCRYNVAGRESTNFGMTPGFFGTVLQSGGGVRVHDVESRGAEMWLALDRGLYKQVRPNAEEEGEWYALLKKNQRPVMASELQFHDDLLLVRTRQGWVTLHLEDEDGYRLLACADPLRPDPSL